MKKIIWILVIILSFVEVVYASDSPLIKNKEVAKVDIKEKLWFTPERVLYGLGENYLVYDSFYTNKISVGSESTNWTGHSLETYKFYDKKWNELLAYQNILTSESKYFVVDNKLYLFSYDGGTKLTVYNENFEFETYNMDFFDKEYNNFYIQEIVADESNLYILIEHSYKDLYKEIKLYDNYSKYEEADLNGLDLNKRFPISYYKYLKSKYMYFAIGNDIYAISYGSEKNLIVYDENFNSKVYNLDFCDKEFSRFEIKDIVVDESNLYILIEHTSYNIYKEIKLYDNYSKYEISDLTRTDIKDKFPKYYNEGSQEIYDDVYYDLSDGNVLISGRVLVYLENGKAKFNFRDEKYKNYGPAKKYNNLIVAIAYKGEKFKSDILFFDLDGNLISTYEHNAYDIDLLFNNNQLTVATVYTDGVCDIVREGYYSYNHNCTGILMNEIYDLDAKFLGMTMSTKEEVKNPETLPDINSIIMLCFIVSIVITFVLFIKFNLKKENFQ